MNHVHRRRARLEGFKNDAQRVRLDRFGNLIMEQRLRPAPQIAACAKAFIVTASRGATSTSSTKGRAAGLSRGHNG
jgi:hypothetical protein